MVSGANVMDFRIENVKSTTLGGTRLTRRWMVDLQKTVARFPALIRHELASTLCSHLGWFTPKGWVVYKFVCKNEKRTVTTDEWLESDVSSGMWRCLDAIPHPGANHS